VVTLTRGRVRLGERGIVVAVTATPTPPYQHMICPSFWDALYLQIAINPPCEVWRIAQKFTSELFGPLAA